MIVEFLEDAEQELVEAALWYESNFPYYLSFFIRGSRIIIAAVAHGHRKPGYWKTRPQP